MQNSNAIRSYNEQSWNLSDWNYLVDEVSQVFKFDEEEKYKIENSNTAKIIATLPFEAQCKEPERTAIAHLCLYVAEIKGFKNIVLIFHPMIRTYTTDSLLFLPLKVEVKKSLTME